MLNEKLQDILNNIQSKFREMAAYNSSVGTGLTSNSLHFKDLTDETAPSS